MNIKQDFCRWVYEDGLAAAEEPSHPCRHMVSWQYANGFSSFQLPEPFGGAKSKIDLAFIGLNPSISQSKSIPKAGVDSKFEDYDRFYRDRFDLLHRRADGSIADKVKLWRNIESFGNRYLSDLVHGQFRMG